MSRVFRNCWSRMQRLRKWGGNTPRLSGSFRLDPRTLRPERLKWLNNPSGKLRKPCDLGLCKSEPEAKTAERGRELRATSRNTRPAFCVGLAPTQPFARRDQELPQGRRHNRRHKRRSYA